MTQFDQCQIMSMRLYVILRIEGQRFNADRARRHVQITSIVFSEGYFYFRRRYAANNILKFCFVSFLKLLQTMKILLDLRTRSIDWPKWERNDRLSELRWEISISREYSQAMEIRELSCILRRGIVFPQIDLVARKL